MSDKIFNAESIKVIPLQFDENLKRVLEMNQAIVRMNGQIIEAMCNPMLVCNPESSDENSP